MFTHHLTTQLSRLLINKVMLYVGPPQVDLVLRAQEKAHRFAAQIAADKAGNAAKEFGMINLDVKVKGPGGGRESAIRALKCMRIKN